MKNMACDYSSKFSIPKVTSICGDGVEFTFKFAITSFCLGRYDNDDENLLSSCEASKNFTIEISFDRNVISIENIEVNDRGQATKCMGAKMNVKASSNEKFADILATHPIEFRLTQKTFEIGSQTLRPSDCFVNLTKSKTFSCETLCKRVNIVKDGKVNAKFSLILLIEKTTTNEMPREGEMNDVKLRKTLISNSTAETCDRKEIDKVFSDKTSTSKTAINNPQKSIKRVCSECFDDLSVLPPNAKCPKCSYHRRVHKEIAQSRLLDERNFFENVNIQKCIKSALEDLFIGDRSSLLMKKSAERVCKSGKRNEIQHNRKSNFTMLKRTRKHGKTFQQR